MKRVNRVIIGVTTALMVIYLLLLVIAYLPYETIPVEELAGEEDKFTEVDGHTVHYLVQGEGEPLILVHGFAGSTYTWRHLIPLLSDHYRVYALDLLGFGLSDKPPKGNYDMESQGKLVIGFMDALKIPYATLVGHSMGGVVVACAAHTAPEKVGALIIIEGGFYGAGTPAFLKYLFFPLDRLMARQFYTRSFRKKFLCASFYNKSLVTDDVISAYMAPTRTPHAIDALAHMMTSVGPQTYEREAQHIKHPTLIVWGERGEKISLERANRLNREVKGSKLIVINGCGHYVQEEKPEELARAIKEFLGLKIVS